MAEIDPSPLPVQPLQYRPEDQPAELLVRVLAWVGVAVGTARLVEAGLTTVSLGLLNGTFGQLPVFYRAIGGVTFVALVILGGLLLTASIGMVKHLEWSASLMDFSEKCAVAVYCFGGIAGVVVIVASQRGSLPDVAYSLGFQATNVIRNLAFPTMALAILHWHARFDVAHEDGVVEE